MGTDSLLTFAEVRAVPEGKTLTVYHVMSDNTVETLLCVAAQTPVADYVITALADLLTTLTDHYTCLGCDALADRLARNGLCVAKERI